MTDDGEHVQERGSGRARLTQDAKLLQPLLILIATVPDDELHYAWMN